MRNLIRGARRKMWALRGYKTGEGPHRLDDRGVARLHREVLKGRIDLFVQCNGKCLSLEEVSPRAGYPGGLVFSYANYDGGFY